MPMLFPQGLAQVAMMLTWEAWQVGAAAPTVRKSHGVPCPRAQPPFRNAYGSEQSPAEEVLDP